MKLVHVYLWIFVGVLTAATPLYSSAFFLPNSLFRTSCGCNPNDPRLSNNIQRQKLQQQSSVNEREDVSKEQPWHPPLNVSHSPSPHMKNLSSTGRHHVMQGINVSSLPFSVFAREEIILQDFRPHLNSIFGVTNPMPCLQRAVCSLSSAAGSHPDSTRNLVRDYLNLLKTSFLRPKTTTAAPYRFEVRTTSSTTPKPKRVEGSDEDDEREEEEEEEDNSGSEEDGKEEEEDEEHNQPPENEEDNSESKESVEENSGSNETEEQADAGEQGEKGAAPENNDKSEESSEEDENSREPEDDDKMYHDYHHGWGWKKGHGHHHKKGHHRAKGYSAEFHYETPGQHHDHHGHGHHGNQGHPFYRGSNVEDDSSLENPSFRKGDPEKLKDRPSDDHGWGWKKKHQKKKHDHGWKKKKHQHHGWKKKKHHHNHHNKFKKGWSQQYHYAATDGHDHEHDHTHYFDVPSLKEWIYSYMPSLTLDIADFWKRSGEAGKYARHLTNDNRDTESLSNKNQQQIKQFKFRNLKKKLIGKLREMSKVKDEGVKFPIEGTLKQGNHSAGRMNKNWPKPVVAIHISMDEQSDQQKSPNKSKIMVEHSKVQNKKTLTNHMKQDPGSNIQLLQLAVETGKKYYNPGECDKIYRGCPWKHNQVLQIIEDSFVKGNGLQHKTKFAVMGGKPPTEISSVLAALTQNVIQNSVRKKTKSSSGVSSSPINPMMPGKGATTLSNTNHVVKRPKVKLHYNAVVVKTVPVQGDNYYNRTTQPDVMDSFKAASVLDLRLKKKKVLHYKYPKFSHRLGFLHNMQKPAMKPRVPPKTKITTSMTPIAKETTTTTTSKPFKQIPTRSTTTTTKRPKTKKPEKKENPLKSKIHKKVHGKNKISVGQNKNTVLVEASEESIIIRIPKTKKAAKGAMADDYGSHYNRDNPYNNYRNTPYQHSHSYSHHAPPKTKLRY